MVQSMSMMKINQKVIANPSIRFHTGKDPLQSKAHLYHGDLKGNRTTVGAYPWEGLKLGPKNSHVPRGSSNTKHWMMDKTFAPVTSSWVQQLKGFLSYIPSGAGLYPCKNISIYHAHLFFAASLYSCTFDPLSMLLINSLSGKAAYCITKMFVHQKWRYCCLWGKIPFPRPNPYRLHWIGGYVHLWKTRKPSCLTRDVVYLSNS